MQGKRIVRPHDRRDAALGVVGVGLGPVFFGDQADGAGGCNLECVPQPGNAAANDEKIKFHFPHCTPAARRRKACGKVCGVVVRRLNVGNDAGFFNNFDLQPDGNWS